MIQELALDGNHANGHVGLLYLVSGSTRAPGYVGVFDKHRLFAGVDTVFPAFQ